VPLWRWQRVVAHAFTCRAGILAVIGLCGLVLTLNAQRLDPVQWSLETDSTHVPAGSTVPLKLTAHIDPGWHLYSLTTPQGGANGSPIQTTINLAQTPAVESSKVYQPKPARKFDPSFGIDIETFSNQVVFWIPATLSTSVPSGSAELTAQVRYQACDDKQCLQPKRKTASTLLTIDPEAPVLSVFSIPAGYTDSSVPPTAPSKPPTAPGNLAAFALAAFGFGLAAIFTPCVFPMIPITVSFFLNQKGGIVQALTFSLGIIGLFTALGLGITAAVGPFGVIQLSASPWVNGFISLVFAVFALSLLGAYEFALPSGLLTKLDSASRRGGMLGTLLMGLTFSLTSFACVGPFVGPLLVASAQGAGPQPVVGMLSFAGGLASPFFLLAAFPSMLKKLPKSGGWLVRVKVVMGFVLLAVMLKYLSNVDQVTQTGILTRERFLAAWFVLFAMPGLYLLGLLRLEGIEASDKLGVGRLLAASAFLIFALSLIPGMFGAPLGELDAYVPAARASLNGGSAEAGPVWMKDQYREALARGRAENKLVLVNFTGYTCTNCHWMEANLYPKPEIAQALSQLVTVKLYTDGTDKTSEENQALEEKKFSTTSMPFYVIMDPDENVVATFPTATRDAQEFLAFLTTRKG
jgi:thiol:disulfide interchange protein